MERKKISGCHKLREGGWLLIVGGFFLACWKCSKNCSGGWVTLNILKTMNKLYLLNRWIVWYVKPFKGKTSWCFPCKSELVQQVREATVGAESGRYFSSVVCGSASTSQTIQYQSLGRWGASMKGKPRSGPSPLWRWADTCCFSQQFPPGERSSLPDSGLRPAPSSILDCYFE